MKIWVEDITNNISFELDCEEEEINCGDIIEYKNEKYVVQSFTIHYISLKNKKYATAIVSTFDKDYKKNTVLNFDKNYYTIKGIEDILLLHGYKIVKNEE